MFQKIQNVSREVGSNGLQIDKSAPQAPLAYATPKLVELGKAHTLVQGTDLYKMTQDANGNFHD